MTRTPAIAIRELRAGAGHMRGEHIRGWGGVVGEDRETTARTEAAFNYRLQHDDRAAARGRAAASGADSGPRLLALSSVPAVRVLLLPALAWNARYVMDEYSQATFPRYIAWGFYNGFDPVKTVLYVYVFEVAHRIARNAVTCCTSRGWKESFSRCWSRDLPSGSPVGWLKPVPSVVLSRRSVLVHEFMEQSFRIRSDTVAVFFATAATFVALGGEGSGRVFLAGLLAGGAFLSTQKAVYPLAALGMAFAVSGLGSLTVRRQIARLGAYAGGILAALLAYAMWFDLRNPARVLSMVFLSPLQYTPLHGNPSYAGIRGHFVMQTILRNPVPYALATLGLVIALARIRSASPRLRLASVMSALVTVLVFQHEQPWPYVFVMALPFLAVFAPDALTWLEGRAGERGPWIRLACCGLLMWQLPRNFAYLGHGNWVQNEVVAHAERLLAPDDRYFDGITMIPTRSSADPVSWEALVLAGVHAELARGDDHSIIRILDAQPKLWILNYRIHELREYLPRLLDPSYVRVHPDILLTGAFLSDSRTSTFVNRWPGRYGLFRSDGSPSFEPWRIDGRDAGPDGFLPVGPHEVAVRPPTGHVTFFRPARSSSRRFR